MFAKWLEIPVYRLAILIAVCTNAPRWAERADGSLYGCVQIKACFKTQFMRQLSAAVKKQLQQANASGGIQSMSVSAAGEHVPAAPAEEGEKAPARRSAKEDEDENAEENEEYNEGKLRFAGKPHFPSSERTCVGWATYGCC